MTAGPSYPTRKPTNPRPSPDASRYAGAGGARPWRRPEEAQADPAGGPRVLESEEADLVDPAVGSTSPARASTGGQAPTMPTMSGREEVPVGRLERDDAPESEPGRTPTSATTSPTRDRATGAPTESPMVRARLPRPRSGWRSVAFSATRGRWNPGPSAKEQRERAREGQIATTLRGRHVTAFFCLKGGISKTSTTAATSIALSDLRPDPVFAIDANPDAGDLAERLIGQKLSGIADLVRNIRKIDSLDALSRYTQTRGRLTVLPGEPNPTLGDSLSADDFESVMRAVQQYYSFIQVDCGTGVTHPLMEGVLRFADTVVIPAAWSVTGAKRAAETIEWLYDNGFTELAQTCIVVLTAKDIVSGAVNKDAVLDHLSRAGDVIVVPADPHVADGAFLEWESLQQPTREAYLDIAAAITRRFGAST